MIARITRIAVVAALAAALPAWPAAAQEALVPYSAEYKVRVSIASGRLTTELRSTDDGFEAVHELVPAGFIGMFKRGIISETSRFRANATGVAPYWYKSEDTLTSDESSAEVSFDWLAHEMTGKINDEDVVIELDEIVHDRVAIQYELMHDLLNGGPSERYVLFDIDEFKTLVVRNIGEKRVKTPAGEFDAVGIQHQRENSSRVTTLWCVEELGYLPVVIEQHRKDKLQMRAELREYTLRPG